MFEKMKIENQKIVMTSSLQLAISFLFQKELNTLKEKRENIVQKFYKSCKDQVDNLRKEI